MSEADIRHDPPGRPLRGGRLAIFSSIVLVGFGVLIGLYFYDAMQAERRLAAAIAAADLSDPYWRLEDLEAQRAVLPDESNSAVVAAAAAQLVPRGWSNFTSGNAFVDMEPHSAQQLSEEQSGILRAQLKAVAPALARARKLKDLPNGRFDIAWSQDGISTLMPHIQSVRELANLLSFDAMLRAQDKDVDGAFESCGAILNAGRSLGDEPTYISALVRVAIRAVAIGRLEKTLSQGEASEAVLAAIQQGWEEEQKFPLLIAAARGERAIGDRSILAMQGGKLNMTAIAGPGGAGVTSSGNGTIDGLIARFRIGSLVTNRAALLELHNEMIAIVKLPEKEHRAGFDQIRAKAAKLPTLARLLFPAAEKVAEANRRSQALMRSTIAALAAERYRKANGHWPESLTVLVPRYLTEPFADPYDWAPLRFRRLTDGLVIYSIGADQQDNGGNLGSGYTTGTDVGIRLWDVEHRRQPPPPVKPAEADNNK